MEIEMTNHSELNMDRKLGSVFDLLRFPLIILVVFIHAYQLEVNVGDGLVSSTAYPVFHTVENLISRHIGLVAVPLFFFIAGYLYFREGIFDAKLYLHKSHSRFFRLLVPYMFWNAWALLFLLAWQYVGSRMGMTYTWGKVQDYSIADVMAAFWKPAGFHLWFLRDLILICLVSPLLFWLIKKFAWWPACIFGTLWLCSLWPPINPNDTAIFFFSMGASYRLLNGKFIDSFNSFISKSSFLYLPLLVLPFFVDDSYLVKPRLLFGVIFILNLMYGYACRKNDNIRGNFFILCSFFVYLFHEPILAYLQKILYAVLHPEGEAGLLLIYFSAPVLTICMALASYALLKKILPQSCFKIINGN